MPKNPKIHIRLDLENEPLIAAKIGDLCVAWAAIEYRVFAMYQLFMGGSTALNRATFYSHHNSRNRLDLLNAVAAVILQDQGGEPLSEYEELNDLLALVNKTASIRNKYIHDVWGAWDDAPDKVFQMRLGKSGRIPKAKRIISNDLKSIISEAHKRDRELHAYQVKLRPMLSALRRKLDRLPTLPLAFAKAELPQEVRPIKRPYRRQS